MKRTLFAARPARSVAYALRAQPRRAFGTPTSKDTTPPDPIEPSKAQAHPLGAYYESIMNTPQPIPDKKPEEPPTSSPKSTSTSTPTPTPAPKTAPAAESTSTPPPSETTTSTPAKRGRKPKESKSAATSSSSSASSQDQIQEQTPDPTPSSVQARARIVFGSRLAGPAERAERLAAARARSRLIAGVLVPPKPEEPDNCCMSGCVNCVWDRYRDEMEEWASKSSEAEARVAALEVGEAVEVNAESMSAERAREEEEESGLVRDEDEDGADEPKRPAMADDDAAAWQKMGVDVGKDKRLAKDFWDEGLYKNVPVGIREFMKQEKRLKEKHLREGRAGD